LTKENSTRSEQKSECMVLRGIFQKCRKDAKALCLIGVMGGHLKLSVKGSTPLFFMGLLWGVAREVWNRAQRVVKSLLKNLSEGKLASENLVGRRGKHSSTSGKGKKPKKKNFQRLVAHRGRKKGVEELNK